MIINAETGLSLLKSTPPDLNEARSALDDIVNDGRRMNEIVGGIRSMFKKGARGQILLDVNELERFPLDMGHHVYPACRK
jgi:hypothetical protein